MKDNSRKPMSRGRQLWRALYPIGMHYLISVAVAVAGAYALTLWYTMHMAGASSEEILYRVAKGACCSPASRRSARAYRHTFCFGLTAKGEKQKKNSCLL